MDKGVHSFPEDISRKVYLIMRLEFEHAHYDVEVHHVCHYATEIPIYIQGVSEK